MKLLLCFFIVAMSTGLWQPRTSLTIIITHKNHIYHYDNDLDSDGSNFKIGYAREIETWSDFLEQENGKENVNYIIKIESVDSLNESSKELVTFFGRKPKFLKSKITRNESLLIDLTEKVNGFK